MFKLILALPTAVCKTLLSST